ncbi:rab GTPase-activating protein 22 isoform X1 [Spinacia oleracea]|uniref:Rab GTPase-activating protein 22 isoform X1 n=1 Tax=Spinacia oleracea TaxID=3562 RepID=A0A9R0I608_SPIOL|nr:rab GTPase-activating protein 22-like isoform X1 [Spinacia oleracea]
MKALRRSHTCSPSPSSSSKSSPSSSNSIKHHYSLPSSSSPSSSSPLSSSWVHLRSALFVVASSSPASSSSHRGHLKSPWSRKKRKHALTLRQWRNSFTPDGKLHDGGIKLLKKVRSGGIDPSIRSEVWPFLLGVYDLKSTKEERDVIRNKNRKEYEKLRRQSRRLLKQTDENSRLNSNGSSESPYSEPSSPASEDVVSARESLSSEKGSSDLEFSENQSSSVLDRSSSSRRVTSSSPSVICSDSSDMGSSEDEQFDEASSPLSDEENDVDVASKGDLSPPKTNPQSNVCRTEDFASWQRIIRLDAVRANAEWTPYSPSQAAVSEDRACRSAEAVGLKDYDHLEPCRIYHAARLVAILEAYAIYDSEIGYCQGMSDLLSPIISVIEEDHMAFWCFVGFMKKARHNFRLDEVGIRRQLNTVAKIIKHKDSHLYKHLVKLQAEDCFFVYRMVVVLFRRELNFEQTLCLWEVMWADQAALRAGVGKSAWRVIRQRAPPTEDLLLYAIAASVLQRRKQIIEKYSSMDEILRECNNMAGHLDIWKLLDGAHDLVMTLHDKVATT